MMVQFQGALVALEAVVCAIRLEILAFAAVSGCSTPLALKYTNRLAKNCKNSGQNMEKLK